MLYYATKLVLSALIIVVVSEVAKFNASLGALIKSLRRSPPCVPNASPLASAGKTKFDSLPAELRSVPPQWRSEKPTIKA